MKTFMTLTAAAVVTVATTMAAYAQGPGSFARYQHQWGGPLHIDASFSGADGCQTILSVGGGAPPGISVRHDTLPATVVIGPDPRGCSGDRVLRRVFTLGASQVHTLVSIFFVTPDGQVLDSELVSIQSF